jgi:hypothetical protein
MKLPANPPRYGVSGLTALGPAHHNLPIAPAALLCAVEGPRRLAEDTTALPWNTI